MDTTNKRCQFAFTATAAVTSPTFNLDHVDVQVHGDPAEIIHMLLNVMEAHPVVLNICGSAVMTYHMKQGTVRDYIRHLKIGAELFGDVFNSDENNGPGV